MKIKDKEFIREIVSSDFKPIPNADFMSDTLEKIAELEDNRLSQSYSGDMFFIIPVIVYVSVFFLLSLIPAFIPRTQVEQVNSILYSLEMISGYLLHPITISILFSFSILYLIDLYLKKITA